MIIFLLLLWVILSGQGSLFFIISAILSVTITILIDKKLFSLSPLWIGGNWRWLIFLANLLKEMLISTIIVLKIIWLNPRGVNPVTINIDTKSKDNIAQVVQANCITLTPGTMSMELKKGQILVHAINQEAAQGIYGDKK